MSVDSARDAYADASFAPPATFSTGIVFGYLASRTGRLGGAVVAHGLNNAIAGVLTLAP